jgi:hypothetical protein
MNINYNKNFVPTALVLKNGERVNINELTG